MKKRLVEWDFKHNIYKKNLNKKIYYLQHGELILEAGVQKENTSNHDDKKYLYIFVIGTKASMCATIFSIE